MKQGIFIIIVLFLALLIGSTIPKVSPIVPITIVAGIAVCFITLVRTDLGLIILLFSMLLSPEITLAEVPERAVVMRVDDILLFVIFFTWLAKMAVHKQFGLLKRTPLNAPIASYILACVLFTVRGIIVGGIHPLKAAFYILKFVEYFMLYFMFVNNITDKKQIRIFIGAFLLTCFIICIYSIIQIFGGAYRPTAPFEGKHPEPNTLAGYLLLVGAVVISLSIHSTSANARLLFGVLSFLILFSFVHTLSRSSYLAFLPMYLTLIIMTKRKKFLLTTVLTFIVILAPLLTPDIVKARIMRTFQFGERADGEYVIEQYGRSQKISKPSMHELDIFGRPITLEASAAARVYHWRYGIKRWKEIPFFGHGITGIGFIDSQYFRVLGELGIIGFIIFMWLLIAIYRAGLRTYQTCQDRFAQALSLGFLAGYTGLLVQAIAVNTFIIVRIMEPFWFLLALVVSLPDLEEYDYREKVS